MIPYQQMLIARRDAQVESWMLRAPLAEPRNGWRHEALCRDCRHWDIDLCATCPVRLDCLRSAWAEEHGNGFPVGTRGGLTESERERWYRGQHATFNPAAEFAQLVLLCDQPNEAN